MAKANANVVTLTFKHDKDTKNTIKFAEVVADDLDTQKVGSIYVNKQTLKELGWTRDKQITVTLSI